MSPVIKLFIKQEGGGVEEEKCEGQRGGYRLTSSFNFDGRCVDVNGVINLEEELAILQSDVTQLDSLELEFRSLEGNQDQDPGECENESEECDQERDTYYPSDGPAADVSITCTTACTTALAFLFVIRDMNSDRSLILINEALMKSVGLDIGHFPRRGHKIPLTCKF